MIRVAAVGDIHVGEDAAGSLRPHFETLPDEADVLLLAGDLTRRGDPAEARVLAEELDGVGVPVFAVLGNHDHHLDQPDIVAKELESVGVRVLEGNGAVVDVGGTRVGVAGTKGFGGGFAGACGTEFGEPEMKAFIGHTRMLADRLRIALKSLHADIKIALLHFSPVEDTLVGERLEIYPFLGSGLLAEAIDAAGADLAVHGHAHAGSEKGLTPGGVHVRNVAQPLLGRAFSVYCFAGGEEVACEPVTAAGERG
ncbi:MAG TPA: metallophosphoesterase [Actinomycetota bacterium]|nr:metallophosphoesterase [Actinomycetota bacterium]